jgi:hypothetical protein
MRAVRKSCNAVAAPNGLARMTCVDGSAHFLGLRGIGSATDGIDRAVATAEKTRQNRG